MKVHPTSSNERSLCDQRSHPGKHQEPVDVEGQARIEKLGEVTREEADDDEARHPGEQIDQSAGIRD